ncbi:hypothetical protein LINGRAHAP2_LOCUS2258, partial [Linum grandiflorum]
GLLQNSGCFGCCAKPAPIIAVDEPSKGLQIQGKAVRKPSLLDGFWSSSSCDLDNSAIHSQRTVSSVSASNQNVASDTGDVMLTACCIHAGLLLWQQSRIHWTGSGEPTTTRANQAPGPRSSWNASYESLLGSRNRFTRPVPLSEMVDFLVDVWEQEGLYD